MKKKILCTLLVMILLLPCLFSGCATAKATATIVITANNNQAGVVSGAGTYEIGTTVTIIAEANNGYYFEQWNDGNTDWKRTIVVSDDCNYVAKFKAGGYTVQDGDYKYVFINGTASIEEDSTGNRLRFCPDNINTFGYWYEGLDSTKILTTAPEYGPKFTDLNRNALFTAVHSHLGWAFASTRDNNYADPEIPTTKSSLTTDLPGLRYIVESKIMSCNSAGESISDNYLITNEIRTATSVSYNVECNNGYNEYFVAYKIFALEGVDINTGVLYLNPWNVLKNNFTFTFNLIENGITYNIVFHNDITD